MTRAKYTVAAACLAALCLGAAFASAAETITAFQWTGSASPPTDWQVDGNWDVTGFPNGALDGANITTGSDLSLNIGASEVTVAELTLEGTSADTDINITAGTGGKLLFNNSDDNTFFTNEDPDIAPWLQPEGEGVNHGRVYVTSNGVAGSTNVISAPIGLRNNGFLEGVDFFGNTSMTLSGDIDIAGYVPAEGEELDHDDTGALRSYLPEGEKLLITGNISLVDSVDPSYPRTLTLNNYFTTDHADPPRGTIEIAGNLSGDGTIVAGSSWFVHAEQIENEADPAPPMAPPFGTVILSGDNSAFTGNVQIARGDLVITSDTALGSDTTVVQNGTSGNSKEVGYNLVVDGDRTISDVRLAITQWQTIKGNGSLTWNDIVYQNGSRGLINLLPHDLQADTGKTLTLTGPVYPNRQMEGPPLPGRAMTFDGTGKTVITGGIHNQYADWDGDPGNPPPDISGDVGSLRKQGTGSLVLDYDEANAEDTPSDYGGHTWVQGGNLHFVTTDDLPNPVTVWDSGIGQILSSCGAVGVDSGVVGNSTFLGMLNNSNNPLQFTNGAGAIFYSWNDQNSPVYTIYDDGGLMLGTGDYGSDLNFNSGDLARAGNMTLAAHETGSTYTGTITPATGLAVNDNMYKLGGGSGTLTLPNDNQLTGSNGLLVSNGGEVLLGGSNNFTGKIHVAGKYKTTHQEDAAVGTADEDNDGDYAEERQAAMFGTTLTATTLTDGGLPSSIGISTSSADNLLIQGSTLKYVGDATSTDRLFTVGTAGATIDSSGSGALNFSNSGALGIDTAEDREGVMKQAVGGTSYDNEVFGIPTLTYLGHKLTFRTDDLVPGMGITDTAYYNPSSPGLQLQDDDSVLVVTDISASHVVHVGETDLSEGETAWSGIPGTGTYVNMIAFGPAPARMLTLTGSNTDANTLTPVVGDASDRDETWTVGGTPIALGGAGGNGSVGIQKTGVGTWILAGANTYTGLTNVDEGTLIVTGATGTGDTTVADGATLGGDGTVQGNLIADGIVAPGTSPGTLSVLGDFTQNATATLAIDIAGTGAGAFDVLDVTGTADLAGLINVVLDPGFTLGGSDSFDILMASTLIDSGIALASGGDNDLFTLLVDTGTGIVTLQAIGGPTLIGDYNDDGVVDAADYTVWRDNVGEAALTNRDPSNGGLVGEDDYLSWKAHFGETAGSGALASLSAVPEPSALCLALVALLGMAAGRLRRR